MRKNFLFFCLAVLYGASFAHAVHAADFVFSQALRRGSAGAEVYLLQEFLKRDSIVYPEGLITGYFGIRTEAAVKRFQKKYGITQLGVVGPRTRQKLNELLRVAEPTATIPAPREIQREVSLPEPLRALKPSPSAEVVLTPLGVFEETNRERLHNNLPALTKNTALDAAASAKLQDMFSRQYFAHESPSGRNAGDLVKEAEYEYINIGENLALGDFTNDITLVLAWMNSPGHRANILGTRFTEIGTAVARGMFEERDTWIAVQIFARPISACPAPEAILRASIEEKRKMIGDLSALAHIKKEEADAIPQNEIERYNAKIFDYNAVAAEFNALIEETKTLVEKYNNQVSAFNACVVSPTF